jgi:trehalose/maltose hydrolase-like predicted phosphorylase
MTYYLLEPEEVSRILTQLGYDVGDPIELLKKNYEYYVARTSHGSTLSKIVHTVIACYVHGCDQAWQWFQEAMESDIYDTQGGTTTEGIHSGVMAGTIEAVTRYFAGIDLSGEVISIHPSLPDHWTNLGFKLLWKSTWYGFRLSPEKINVRVEGKGHRSIPVRVEDTQLTLAPGEEEEVRY